MDYISQISDYIDKEIEILRKINIHEINTLMNILYDANKRKSDIYIFGNGGSGSTASHYANDFNLNGCEFRFICLNDNIPTITAIANDTSYDKIFYNQLETRLRADDIVIAISGSGNSKNIIEAVQLARDRGNTVVGITGFDGGELKKLSHISLHVPINDMHISEDIHLIFDHIMNSIFRKLNK